MKKKALKKTTEEVEKETIKKTTKDIVDALEKGARINVLVPALELQTVVLPIRGTTPLICHQFDEKTKIQIIKKHTGEAPKPRKHKDPHQLFLDSLYEHPDGGYGFPSNAFKKAAVSACRFVPGYKMTEARGAFYVQGEYVKIEGEPTMREDMVRLNGTTADVRFRGQFKEWRADLEVMFNPSVISVQELINLYNLAGFGVGIGEWRPEKSGQYGRFSVEMEAGE